MTENVTLIESHTKKATRLEQRTGVEVTALSRDVPT